MTTDASAQAQPPRKDSALHFPLQDNERVLMILPQALDLTCGRAPC